MSIRTLETLIAVAEEGGFTAAAERMNVTHAAVSQRMKALEEEMPFPVFDRTGRIPRLTPAGLALAAKAREVVASYNNLAASVIGEAALTGEFALGALPTTLAGLVPAALEALRARFPDLRVRVVPGLSLDLIAQVERGTLDAAIATPPSEGLSPLDFRPFVEEPLVAIASKEILEEDPMKLLKSYPFIRYNRRALVGGIIERWLRSNGITVNEAMELDTLESVSAMVYHNLGVSIIPKPCVPGPNPLPLRLLPLEGRDVSRTLGLISRPDNLRTQLLSALETVLIDVSE